MSTAEAARRVKILATIGPASASPAQLAALLGAGVDAVRLNMSHGTHREHAAVIAAVRRLAEEMGRSVPVLLDLQGPKIRTGPLIGGTPVLLADGDSFTITTRSVPGDAACVSTTYDRLPQDVRAGETILLNDGLLALYVTATTETDVISRVVHGGILGEHKGINLPGTAISAPALTAKDEEDLAFGLAEAVDYVALSFVREAADVEEVRRRVQAHGASASVIAKLEKPAAIEHLDAILQVAAGVMIARGDLGVELPLEQVPLLQKEIIRRANQAGVLVITATQMLESMISQARPTRAEASDVANAVLDGTDVVMLSGETAVGNYPIETVRTMARIVTMAEAACPVTPKADRLRSHAHALAHAAATLVANTPVRAVVVFTKSGLSSRLVAKERSTAPILAFTDSPQVANQLGLWWGVTPFLCRFQPTTDAQIAVLQEALLSGGHADPGDTVVIMGSLPVMEHARTNFLKLHRVEHTTN